MGGNGGLLVCSWRLRREAAVMSSVRHPGASDRVTAFQQAQGMLQAWAHIMSTTEAPSLKGSGQHHALCDARSGLPFMVSIPPMAPLRVICQSVCQPEPHKSQWSCCRVKPRLTISMKAISAHMVSLANIPLHGRQEFSAQPLSAVAIQVLFCCRSTMCP